MKIIFLHEIKITMSDFVSAPKRLRRTYDVKTAKSTKVKLARFYDNDVSSSDQFENPNKTESFRDDEDRNEQISGKLDEQQQILLKPIRKGLKRNYSQIEVLNENNNSLMNIIGPLMNMSENENDTVSLKKEHELLDIFTVSDPNSNVLDDKSVRVSDDEPPINLSKILSLLEEQDTKMARNVANIIRKFTTEFNPEYERQRAELFCINETDGKLKFPRIRQRKCWAAYCWNQGYHGHPKNTPRYLVDLDKIRNDKMKYNIMSSFKKESYEFNSLAACKMQNKIWFIKFL